jgi:hypothetical protein
MGHKDLDFLFINANRTVMKVEHVVHSLLLRVLVPPVIRLPKSL